MAGDDGEVGSICAGVLRLPQGERHYAACIQSLSNSLRSADSRSALSEARAACLRRGAASGTPALAECTLDAADTRPAADADPAPMRNIAPPGGTRSYFAIPPSTAFRRDQLACAELGLDPAGAAFSACAIDLKAALVAADNPMN
ncbi:MAG TPA: hypothetical protein VME40_07920 [Caulobacteraceae bacterium]|nr:hypothetical protein [Caulobacteraceae bacterium]